MLSQFKIQNSKFIIPFALRWRKLAASAQFKIHNSLPVPLVPPISQSPVRLVLPAFPFLPPVQSFPLVPPVVPLVPLVPLVSPVLAVPQFKIHNLPIPLALFRAHYRL